MSDGTTGIQVAPVASEDEMRSLQTMFQRVASSIVAASEYPAKLAELARQVDEYKAKVDSLTSLNDAHYQTIIELRAERDEAHATIEEQKRVIEGLGQQTTLLSNQKIEAEDKANDLRSRLSAVEIERDYYGYEMLGLKDDHAKAQADLAELKSAMDKIFGKPKAEDPNANNLPTPTQLEEYSPPHESSAAPEWNQPPTPTITDPIHIDEPWNSWRT